MGWQKIAHSFRREIAMKPAPHQVYGIIAALFMVCLPHAEHLPHWVSAVCSFLLIWRFHLAWTGNALPSRWLLISFTVAASAGIAVSFHTLFGRDAGVTLLVLLSSLKLMELRTARDANVVIFLACFIIITNFFYSQSIPTALFMLVTLLAILNGWLAMQASALAWRARLRMAAIMLLQAMPLTLLLFVLFPRVQGPLWGMPQDAWAQSGLSDTMSPGSMSKLSLSDAVAFRVSFDGPPPPQQLLYWRGPVLWDFEGTTWKRGQALLTTVHDLQQVSMPVDYTVTLEPHDKNWLFALDMPTSADVPSRISGDFQLLSRTSVTTRLRYRVHSQLGFQANTEESPALLQRALRLPAAGNPQSRNLAATWRRKLGNDAAIIHAAEQMFHNEGYTYTLEPPLLGNDSVDDFLFHSRKGFCEHYASAFVFLMRAAGIPARVVTGYQGGEYNDLGQYFIVRQSDAHAWSEVWLAGQGWQRVDPTATISPARISTGLSAAVPGSEALPFAARYRSPWLLKLRFNLDLFNYRWNQWVLGYDKERQFAFLTRLGMEEVTWQKMALNLLAGVGILVALFSLLILKRLYAGPRDPAVRLYRRFCRKLARHGYARSDHEGPMDYASRASAALPHKADAIQDITRRYLSIRYESRSDPENLRALRHAVAAFKL